MITFEEFLKGKKSIHSKESIDECFYKDIDIRTCSLGNDSRRIPESVFTPLIKLGTIHFNGFKDNYYGWSGENWFFLDTERNTLHEHTIQTDYDYEYTRAVFARTGYLVKLTIQNNTACFMEPPVLYHMLYWEYRDEGYGKRISHIDSIPYIKTFPLSTIHQAREIEARLQLLHPTKRLHITAQFTTIQTIPPPLRNLYLRKNKMLWWNANKIARAWSNVFWNPYTAVGKRRLERNFSKLLA